MGVRPPLPARLPAAVFKDKVKGRAQGRDYYVHTFRLKETVSEHGKRPLGGILNRNLPPLKGHFCCFEG